VTVIIAGRERVVYYRGNANRVDLLGTRKAGIKGKVFEYFCRKIKKRTDTRV